MDRAIARLRATDFSRLDDRHHVYLDYTGAALYPLSLVQAHHTFLATSLLGNPHSTNPTSQCSTHIMEATRSDILAFFHADPLKYTVIFTANASAAIKLVAESFPFRPGSTLLLSADNHNSVLGIREYAIRAQAGVHYLPLTHDMRMCPTSVCDALLSPSYRPRTHPSLFAYPAQSNFSGVKHGLSYFRAARSAGWYTLLDAAAYAPTSSLDLSSSSTLPAAVRPDFVPVSFYKMFGFPTGVGALIAKREALAQLQRPWFAGGTVHFSSVNTGLHALQGDATGFEDGTPNFVAYAAVREGLRYLSQIGMARISTHVERLTQRLLAGLAEVRWPRCETKSGCGGGDEDGDENEDEEKDKENRDGVRDAKAIRVYGPMNMEGRGGTVTFDVVRSDVRVDARKVESAANEAGISLRAGCFCNPGAAEKALSIPAERVRACLGEMGEDFSADRMSRCVGGGYLGCVRVSVGLGNSLEDVQSFLRFIAKFCEEVDVREFGRGPVETTGEAGAKRSEEVEVEWMKRGSVASGMCKMRKFFTRCSRIQRVGGARRGCEEGSGGCVDK